MRIRQDNFAFGFNQMQKNQTALKKSLNKLATGFYVNKSSDDAAGLSISEKMRSQIRGLEMSSKNIQDGVSLIQTAEGALNEIHSMLQRVRELTVQGLNGTNHDSDNEQIQLEVEQLLKEIDNVAKTTEFNGMKLLSENSNSNGSGSVTPPTGGGSETPPTGGGDTETNPYPPEIPSGGSIPLATDGSQITQFQNFLKAQALTQSEKLIFELYGINGNGSRLHFNVTANPESKAASAYFVSYKEDAQGRTILGQITFDINKFKDAIDFNAKGAQEEFDRIVAHEMVHATMAATMNFASIPTWFKEGTAEMIHGADDRVKAHMAVDGAQKIVNAIGGWTGTGTSIQYSAAYVATKYLHDKLLQAGGEGIKDLMAILSGPTAPTLDTALKQVQGGYSNGLTGFMNDFKANGVNFINTKMNLTDADTGAIGGSDYSGPLKTNESTIPDIGNYTETPLNSYDSRFTAYDPFDDFLGGFFGYAPTSATTNSTGLGIHSNEKIVFQIGANSGNSLSIEITNLSVDNLGISNIGVTNGKEASLDKIDIAINIVSNERGRYGAYKNRLEHAMNYNQNAAENLINAESRIRDTDIAKEMANFTKLNILQQASSALMAQSNQNAQMILQLLR